MTLMRQSLARSMRWRWRRFVLRAALLADRGAGRSRCIAAWDLGVRDDSRRFGSSSVSAAANLHS